MSMVNHDGQLAGADRRRGWKQAVRLAMGLLAAGGAGAADYSRTIGEMPAWITNQMQLHGASSIALALVDGTQAVWIAGFGLADPVEGVPADADTVYRICSVSKTFTTLTAMREVDHGRLNLELPVTNYLPAFRLPARFPGAAPITLRMLLNHQSGMPGNYVPYGDATAQDFSYAGKVLANFADDIPVFPPGFTDTYCNDGFTVMGSVLAELSGTSCMHHVTASLLAPLGMHATTFLYDTNRFNGRLARSMSGTNAYPDEVVNVFASGGLYSTANDMARLVEMLLGGGEFRGVRLLSTNALEAMYAWQGTHVQILGENPNALNGLGLDNVAEPSLAYAGRACWKSGDSMCFHAMLEVMPERGLGVAVMCNGGSIAVETAHRVLMSALRDKFGLPVPTNTVPFPDSPAVPEPPLPWEQLTGFYAHAGGYISVTSDSQSLTFKITVPDQDNYVYSNQVPHANGWFWTPGDTAMQVGFTNVQGRLFALMRAPGTWTWNTSLLGEKVEPALIAPAWQARALTKWVAADMWASSFQWATDTLAARSLLVTNGLLIFGHVFLPVNDLLAYPPIAGRNADGALKVVATNGEEWLRLSGVHYRPVQNLPSLPVPGAATGTLAGDITGWHRLPRTGSGALELQLSASQPFRVYVLNDKFRQLALRQPRAGRILADAAGAAYVAVTRGASAGGNYELRALWRRMPADYDGDRRAELALYSAPTARWNVALSSAGYAQSSGVDLGGPGWAAAPEDYDGDGKVDPAVFHAAAGAWRVRLSGSGYAEAGLDGFGGAGATAAPADYDGDGKADPAYYRAADGMWGYRLSASNYAVFAFSYAAGADCTAAPADYDGDGKADPAVYRAADSAWRVRLSGSGYAEAGLDGFGGTDATAAPADYDGDGKADPAYYRATDGTWGFRLSASGYALAQAVNFTPAGGTAAPADYDGDGKADPAGYRAADGTWSARLSGSGYALQQGTFGGSGYLPAR